MVYYTGKLDLAPMEPGEDLLSDQFFDILRDLLQPRSEMPLEFAVQHITALFPQGKPYSSEVGTLLRHAMTLPNRFPTTIRQ